MSDDESFGPADEGRAHLERLRIPIGHAPDRRHLVESIGKRVEFLDAVRKADGQLFGEELRGAEQGTWGGRRARLSVTVASPKTALGWRTWAGET